MNSYKLKVKTAEAFSRFGWKPCDESSLRLFSGVSQKWFDTAVGPKSAVIYMEPSSEGGLNLKAEYRSEGNNVLSTLCEQVHLDVEGDELSNIVSGFNDKVVAVIEKTYAVRLLAPGHSVWNPAVA